MNLDAADDFDEDALRNGARMLWVALAGAVVFLLASVAGKPGVAMTGLVASWLGGMFGIRQVARASGANSLISLFAIVGSFMPLLNLAIIGAYLKRARDALRAGPELVHEPQRPPAASRPQASQPAASKPAAPKPAMDWPANWSPARARHELVNAIAMVKNAGFTTPIADGDQLGISMKLPNGEALPLDSQPVARATSGAFVVFYALDRGDDFIFVTRGDMAKAGLTLHELHAIGLRNLAQQCNGNPGLTLLPQPEGHFGLVMGGNFEASLVLLDPLWEEQLKEHIPNGAIVGIPARDMCVFCDAKSRGGIAKVHEIVKRAHARGDHVISNKLFMRKEGQWRMIGQPGS